MNQDQVKERLLQLEQVKTDFMVTFSGKNSKKVDGLYYPDKREIIIHNQNFVDDNQLMYTAIHEFCSSCAIYTNLCPCNSEGAFIRLLEYFSYFAFSC